MSTRSRMATAAVLMLGMSGSGLTACNWTKFSKDAEHAPVRSIGSPAGFDSSDFGRSVMPLSSGQGSAAAFVATGFNGSHMVLVKLDNGGGVTSTAVSETSFAATESSAVSSVAEVAGSAPTRLLLGSPTVRDKDFGRVYTYQLPAPGSTGLGDPDVTTLQIPVLGTMDSGLGRGLATGFVAGVATTPDFIIGGDNDLSVVVDGAVATTIVGDVPVDVAAPGTGAPCEVAYEHTQDQRYLARRPLMAASLWPDPTGAQQILVGSTHAGAMGQVGIMSVGAGGTLLSCLATIPGTAPQFGHSFAVGDFDGDGFADDLAIAAPPRQVIVYLGWSKLPIGAVPVPLPPIAPDGAVDFGFSMTALNVDGVPGDELLVGDPRAAVGGTTGAGHVLTFKYNATGKTMLPLDGPLAEIADHSPEGDANFGYTVNALNFCRSDPAALAGAACPAADLSRILVVGASNEVFVYFRAGANIPIPDGETVPDVRTP